MTVYFFHVKHSKGVDEDLEGLSFDTTDDAKAGAAERLREVVATDLRAARPIDIFGIEITEPTGSVVAFVSVDEAVMSYLDDQSPG